MGNCEAVKWGQRNRNGEAVENKNNFCLYNFSDFFFIRAVGNKHCVSKHFSIECSVRVFEVCLREFEGLEKTSSKVFFIFRFDLCLF